MTNFKHRTQHSGLLNKLRLNISKVRGLLIDLS